MQRAFDDGRVCVTPGPDWASVSAPNVAEEEVEALLAETRSLIPAEKLTTWWIGPSARPLESSPASRRSAFRSRMTVSRSSSRSCAPRSRRRFQPGSRCAASRPTATSSPPARCNGMPSRRRRIDASSSGPACARTSTSRCSRRARRIRRLPRRSSRGECDVDPSSRGVFLIAGAVAPWARGRGLYRALVRARWDDAVERGTPALITQANPKTSYPILRRLGFEETVRFAALKTCAERRIIEQ